MFKMLLPICQNILRHVPITWSALFLILFYTSCTLCHKWLLAGVEPTACNTFQGWMSRITRKLLEFTPKEDSPKRWKDPSCNWRRCRLNDVNRDDIDDFLQYSFTVILMISCNIPSLWYWWFPAIFIHCDSDDFLQYSFAMILMTSSSIPSLWYWWFLAILLHCDTDDFLQYSFTVIVMISCNILSLSCW